MSTTMRACDSPAAIASSVNRRRNGTFALHPDMTLFIIRQREPCRSRPTASAIAAVFGLLGRGALTPGSDQACHCARRLPRVQALIKLTSGILHAEQSSPRRKPLMKRVKTTSWRILWYIDHARCGLTEAPPGTPFGKAMNGDISFGRRRMEPYASRSSSRHSF
jgi:hypothetical protein